MGKWKIEIESIQLQCDKMKRRVGISFNLNPIMHYEEDVEESENAFVIAKPYGFCNYGFHCMDDVITSCKHTFHPFCLGAMLKYLNKCCVCNVTFHPDWWTSWGF
jgi:hypothetical protein